MTTENALFLREIQPMHFTIREILARLVDPKTVAIWATVTLTCIVAGPFGTDDMPLITRAPYWIVANAGALVLSNIIIFSAYRLEMLQVLPPIARGMIGAAGFSVIYAALMAGAGALIFPQSEQFPGFWLMLLYVGPIAVAITAIVQLFIVGEEDQTGTPEDTSPRILKRLKPGLEARLIRMSMQDHYVEVFTTNGSQLILMRFADALEEVTGEVGWRVHRSHWIAEAAMKGLKRRDGKTLIETEDGAEIPVSRTYMPALRDAGVIQRF